MVGWFIVHPRKAFDPPVDRDFGLLFQNFFIDAEPDRRRFVAMDWNWHTINGRSGPYATPLVVKHGERVRVRIMDFSPDAASSDPSARPHVLGHGARGRADARSRPGCRAIPS